MFDRWERFCFDFVHIGFDRSLNAVFALHKVFHEFGGFTGENAEHIVHHQNLTVAIHACTNTDGRARNGFGYFFRQLCRNAFHQYDCRTCRIMRFGVVEQRFRLVASALYFIAAECKHGLRSQADVGANRDTAHLQKFSGLRHPDTTFKLDHMRAGRHQLCRRRKCLLFALLICAKRQITDNHGIFSAASHAFSVVAHILQAHRQSGLTTLHRHAQRIAYQQYIHAGIVHQRGKAGFISGQHGDFLALCFHFLQSVYGNHGVLCVPPDGQPLL